MSLKKEFDNLKFDVRMQDINLGNKMISSDDIKNNLSSLQDCSHNATQISIDEPTEEAVQEVAHEEQQQVTTQGPMMGNFNSNPFGSGNNN